MKKIAFLLLIGSCLYADDDQSIQNQIEIHNGYKTYISSSNISTQIIGANNFDLATTNQWIDLLMKQNNANLFDPVIPKNESSIDDIFSISQVKYDKQYININLITSSIGEMQIEIFKVNGEILKNFDFNITEPGKHSFKLAHKLSNQALVVLVKFNNQQKTAFINANK